MGKFVCSKASNKMHNYKTCRDKNTETYGSDKESSGGLLAERYLNVAVKIFNFGPAV